MVWNNLVTQGTWTKARLRSVLENHISRVVRHFKGKCYSWDVVSHATYPWSDSYTENVLYNVLGPEYISIAFKAAKAADPSARLYYATGFSLPYTNAITGALQVIDQLKADRAPINGVALELQAYATASIDEDALVKWLDIFASQGLDVAYTGLQINLVPTLDTECFQNQRNRAYQAVVGSCQRVCRCVGGNLIFFSLLPTKLRSPCSTSTSLPTRCVHTPNEPFSWLIMHPPYAIVTVSNYNVLFDGSFKKNSAYTAIASKLKDSHQPCGSTPTKDPSTTAATGTPTNCPMPSLPHWAQCGGTGWLGSTTCEAPYTCVVINVEYSQCL